NASGPHGQATTSGKRRIGVAVRVAPATASGLHGQATEPDSGAAGIRTRGGEEGPRSLEGEPIDAVVLRRFYGARGHAPAWDITPRGHADGLIAAIQDAGAHGLDSTAY